MQAVELAKRWDNETRSRGGPAPRGFGRWHHRAITGCSAPAVAAGTTQDPTWAAPLVNYRIMTDEFIELLRPATIVLAG
jgi:hypothetical protein